MQNHCHELSRELGFPDSFLTALLLPTPQWRPFPIDGARLPSSVLIIAIALDRHPLADVALPINEASIRDHDPIISEIDCSREILSLPACALPQ